MVKSPSYRTLLRRMPKCLAGLDQEETPADFAWLVEHEIDLYEEGEDSDIRNRRDLQACRRFLAWCRSFGPNTEG